MIGRQAEYARLDQLVKDKKSHFVALYGRRRVGKTYLVRSYFDHQFTFYVTGLANADMSMQLQNFHNELRKSIDYEEQNAPKNWMEAFAHLKRIVELSTEKKKVIFLDEMPWMDTPRSYFLTALESFWNSWASARKDILLVACGSATSWMINKLIRNTGGLHNRVTARMNIQPFQLAEVKAYFESKGAQYDHYQLVQLYMALGGVPFYLDQVNVTESASQNIDRLFFHNNAMMRGEFRLLFDSLFKSSDKHMAIVSALAKAGKGLNQADIKKATGLKSGGSFTNTLLELEESRFIRSYERIDTASKYTLYQLIDNYSLFYHKFLDGKSNRAKNYWINLNHTPQYYNWAGYAFEIVCLQHIDQIKEALGISGVYTETGSWQNNNAQIDLILDRKDQVINLLEMKFSINEYTIDKKYAQVLQNKIGEFTKQYKSQKAVWLVMLTTYGLKESKYNGLVQKSITMDQLFTFAKNIT